jgi:hypothetical protein
VSLRRSCFTVAIGAGLAAVFAPACTQGQGTGSASGTLDILNCWSGPFDLHPDFFAAIPSAPQDALQIRIQNGGDYETFSDGIAILVDDAGEVRGDTAADGSPRPSLLGQTLVVGLPPGVTAPGVPVMVVANPPIVHASLYLERSCRVNNVALYAVSAVALNPDGTCDRPEGGEPPACGVPATVPQEGGAIDEAGTGASLSGADAATGAADAGDATAATDGAVSTEAGPAQPIGVSTIVFSSLFDGNAAETNAQQRLTDATFDLYFADPRETCPGGLGPPPRCRGHLQGFFRFYFERGQPAQPFP